MALTTERIADLRAYMKNELADVQLDPDMHVHVSVYNTAELTTEGVDMIVDLVVNRLSDLSINDIE
jgi:hypothetical protein